MSEQAHSSEPFFFGVMVLQDGKWAPRSRFDSKSFGSALLEAEGLDDMSGFEGVKVMRIPAPGSSVKQKEMWLSPRLKALSAAKAATQFQAGVKQSKQKLEDAHAQRKASASKA